MRRSPLSVGHDEATLESYREFHVGIPEWMVRGVFDWTCWALPLGSNLRAGEQYFRVRLGWADMLAAL